MKNQQDAGNWMLAMVLCIAVINELIRQTQLQQRLDDASCRQRLSHR